MKNHELLLRACAALKDRGHEFRCVLVGDGVERGEVEARRAGLHLDEVVEMTGAADQDGVLERWREAQIGVLTSSSEGMPVALMEAAACGVPVVATAVGGVGELVEHGLTGLLVPAGDDAALADALEQLLTEPDTARKMGKAARLRAEELFSVHREVDALLALWDRILERRLTA